MTTYHPLRQVGEHLIRNKDPLAEVRLFTRRAMIALVLVLICLATLIGRLAYLQVLHHDHFTTLSENNRIKLQPLQPARGLIFDRNGVLLADNLVSYSLEITPDEAKDLDETLAYIRQRIEVSDTDLERFRKLASRTSRYNSTPLRFNLTETEIANIAVDLHRLPGVEITVGLSRHYPLGPLVAHIVGYVGRIDENELQTLDPAEYRGASHIGKTGVERSYETMLHGQAGYRQVETNAEGRALRVLERKAPIPGKNIFLTIDVRLQEIAEQVLGDYNGAIVALDPRNGDILALASMPTYDPNPFVNGIDYASFKVLNTSPDRPLYNRALRGVYPPGSTIKPIVGLAGLDYGVIKPQQSIYCPGLLRLPGSSHAFRDWKRGGHGSVNLDKAITQSCDVYFYKLGLTLGIDRLHDFLVRFGLGRRTGVDLPGEQSGVVPSPAWKSKTRKKPWLPGETVIASIGQGYMLTTPLQLAHATAVLAQNGRPFQPRILLASQEYSGAEKRLAASVPLPPVEVNNPAYWKTVRTGMMHVVHGGGGTAGKIGRGSAYLIAGKTGTAQVFSLGQNQRYNAKRLAKHLRDHALFIAFAPADNPRIAVAVIAEHGGGGSATAAPMAKKVMDAYLLKLK